jgi:hypothetical protein
MPRTHVPLYPPLEDLVLVQFNTDDHIDGSAAAEAEIVERVSHILSHFEKHLTRVEIHLTDENSGAKGGATDIRCTLEARITGMDPVAVTHDAGHPNQAADGAARKMRSALDTALGKAGRR